MKKVKNKALWLGLVLALVACSTQQPPQQQPPQQPPQATATPQEIATGLQSLASEIQQAIQEIQSTLEGVVPLQLANQGLGLEDLKALPHLDLQKLLNTNPLHLRGCRKTPPRPATRPWPAASPTSVACPDTPRPRSPQG